MLLTDDIASTTYTIKMPTPNECCQTLLTAIWITESTSATAIETSIHHYMTAVDESLKSVTWDQVQLATNSDEDMATLLSLIESDTPKFCHQLPPQLQEYHQFREHLSSIDGVITYKDRVLIPPSLRKDVLLALHSADSGITSMVVHTESSVFWPGITPAIHATHQQCNHCNCMAPSQPSALPTPPTPTIYPFQCICADFFFYKGLMYLIYVDHYSNWPVIKRSSDGAKGLIGCAFATYGIPEELASNGGLNLKPPSPKTFCRPGVYITGCPLLPSPAPTTELRLGSSQQKESSPITQDQTAASMLMHYKEPSFFTETHWIQQPNSPLPSYSLDGPFGDFIPTVSWMIQAPQDLAGKPPCT